MSAKMPEDVKQVCIWIVRGHQRRAQECGKRGKTSREEVARMAAVESAAREIGKDLESPELRKSLTEAILLNLSSGAKYPYERLGIDGISRADFYRRKRKFLWSVAKRMNLIN